MNSPAPFFVLTSNASLRFSTLRHTRFTARPCLSTTSQRRLFFFYFLVFFDQLRVAFSLLNTAFLRPRRRRKREHQFVAFHGVRVEFYSRSFRRSCHAFMPSATANRFAVVFASRRKIDRMDHAMGNRSTAGSSRECWYPTSIPRFFSSSLLLVVVVFSTT